MSIRAVEDAIDHARRVVAEWDAVGLTGWREYQTRCATIDPILRGLEWNTADPKECYPVRRARYGNRGLHCGVVSISSSETGQNIVSAPHTGYTAADSNAKRRIGVTIMGSRPVS